MVLQLGLYSYCPRARRFLCTCIMNQHEWHGRTKWVIFPICISVLSSRLVMRHLFGRQEGCLPLVLVLGSWLSLSNLASRHSICACVCVCDRVQTVNAVVANVAGRRSVFCWSLNRTFRSDHAARCKSRSHLLRVRWDRTSNVALCQWDERMGCCGMLLVVLSTTTTWTRTGPLFCLHPSICLSVPLIDSSVSGWRVCCLTPASAADMDRQLWAHDAGSGAQQQMRVASCCSDGRGLTQIVCTVLLPCNTVINYSLQNT